MERVKGIEPSRPAWKAGALPLSYTRKIKKWSEQQDSNLRPPGPKPGALPNCAMPRYLPSIVTNQLNCPWETLFRYRLLLTVTTNI